LKRQKLLLVLSLVFCVACGSSSPSAPTPPPALSAPSPDAPVNGQQLDTLRPTLTVRNGSSDQNGARSYEFQIASSDSFATALVTKTGVPEDPAGRTSFTAEQDLQPNVQLYWRARMTQGSSTSNWSPAATFATKTQGYLQGAELYDPLTNGSTVGQTHGAVTFVPGIGARLESFTSYISYQLPQTLSEGEFSIITTNLLADTSGDKTKLFAMAQGYTDIVTNARRMTVEKRGNPPGTVAWRFITSGDQIETFSDAERFTRNFQTSKTYFWQATWRGGQFRVRIHENGPTGPQIYDFGKAYSGVYNPTPHVIYVGAPIGRSGPTAASVPGVIIRQVWVSGSPRPAFANR
jgi:hypothetical protein